MLVNERKEGDCCPDRGEQVSGPSRIQEVEELRLFRCGGGVAAGRVRSRIGRQHRDWAVAWRGGNAALSAAGGISTRLEHLVVSIAFLVMFQYPETMCNLIFNTIIQWFYSSCNMRGHNQMR